MSSSRAGAGVALGLAGGLTLAGASLAAWVREVRVDDVAGVPIEAENLTLGVDLAPLALPLGVAAVALSFGLAVRRPALRRVAAAVLAAVGVAALVAVGAGVVAGLGLGHGIEAGAVLAVGAGVAVTTAGVIVALPAGPPPALPPRYDLDAEDDDAAEWRMASAEEDEEGP